ncbi:MAG: DUF2470 domain-containing protein [Pseudomonadota bacterium]|nr:DUF2470 domain-containing protein [Pseudomonadota bacterium]
MNNSIKRLGTDVRNLCRCAIKATLCTTNSDRNKYAGWPTGSLVTIATAWNGSPILLLSDLSAHTKNILMDDRASLLIEDDKRLVNPQRSRRVNLIGKIKRLKDKKFSYRFLARHPEANLYSRFSDFNFFTMDVKDCQYIAGFAQAFEVNAKNIVLQNKDWKEVAVAEQNILEHMNTDHKDSLTLYGNKLLGKRGKYWQLIGIDPDGIELRCGTSLHRLEFRKRVTNATACRAALISLSKEARLV